MHVMCSHTENYKHKQLCIIVHIITTYLLHQRQWDVKVEYSIHVEYQSACLNFRTTLEVYNLYLNIKQLQKGEVPFVECCQQKNPSMHPARKVGDFTPCNITKLEIISCSFVIAHGNCRFAEQPISIAF